MFSSPILALVYIWMTTVSEQHWQHLSRLEILVFHRLEIWAQPTGSPTPLPAPSGPQYGPGVPCLTSKETRSIRQVAVVLGFNSHEVVLCGERGMIERRHRSFEFLPESSKMAELFERHMQHSKESSWRNLDRGCEIETSSKSYLLRDLVQLEQMLYQPNAYLVIFRITLWIHLEVLFPTEFPTFGLRTSRVLLLPHLWHLIR